MGKLTKPAYEQLIAEDIEWLEFMAPNTLERQHIIQVLKESPEQEYDREEELRRVKRALESALGLLGRSATSDPAERREVIDQGWKALKR